MKISTYHKMLGDKVRFYKGDLKDFIINDLYESALPRLRRINKSVSWELHGSLIKKYIQLKRASTFEEISRLSPESSSQIKLYLDRISNYYKRKEYAQNPQYDRIYVTTLFTFYWKITIETIHFAKKLVKSQDQLLIGGVMASLLPKEIEIETGIKPMTGLLDRPGVLDQSPIAKNIIIDDLPLDYSILDEIEYEYPTKSAYYTFMTKGCTRKCAFCSVPKLEPTYKPKIETIDKFGEVNVRFGEQQNLLLMDNNVLASPKFAEIIQEIKDMGFYKGAVYKEPDQLKIAIKNLRSGYNDRAYKNRSYKLIHEISAKVKSSDKESFYDILERFNLVLLETTTKSNLLKAYRELSPYYEKYRNKTARKRYVDFNQGTDARYVTDELMRLMSEIPIKPLRIAFDYLGIKKQYINAVELAAKYHINELSNYLLYNFNDTPSDLYERLSINVDLGERLGIHIYSFPMKYIPLFGEEAKDREFIGKKWNKKFIRAVQSILNVTKGIVAPGRHFFERAFGESITEFYSLLYMPETYIVYRSLFEELGYTRIWNETYESLSVSEREEAHSLIEANDFRDYEKKTSNVRILELLKHYTIKRQDIKQDTDHKKLKRKFDKLIKKNQHHNLTLTYDFEAIEAKKKHVALV